VRQSRSFSLSARAQHDLRDIYNYIAADNPEAADGLLDLIAGKIEWLAETGFDGVSREWVYPGLRALPLRSSYCIYFIADEASVKVLRVLHGAQNTDAESFSDTDS